jgi:glycosyltransferase involved in cell wall biosynthesis
MTSHPLWSASLPERLRALKAGTQRVAFISAKPDVGTFRYRCFNPVEAINSHSTTLSASYFFLSDLATLDDLSEFADVLVVSRIPYDAPLDRLYRRFRNRGRQVLFDIDDLVVDARYAALVAANLRYQLEGEDLNQWTAFLSNIGRAMRDADQVITTTHFLAERIRELTPTPVHVIPNTLNAHQIAISESLTSNQGAEDALRIAYFSGSPSHALDFAVAQTGIADFLRHSPGSTFTVVGHLDVPDDLAQLSSQVVRQPFMDFLDMQTLLASVDVSIVPLQNSAFTHSKSELKYFEAAAVSTLTLASRSPVFSDAISHGVNGFLAEDYQWRSVLEDIASLGVSQRHVIANNARTHALAHYSPEILASRYGEILG